MGFRTIVIESQCRCSYQGGYMVVRKEDDTSKIHLSEISSVILQTLQIYISAYLLSEFAKAKISLVVCDDKCNPVGQFLPIYGSHNCSKRITEQLAWGDPIKKRVWQRIVKDKIHQQRAFLEERDYEEHKLLRTAEQEVRSGDVTNREAQAARIYFCALFGNAFSRDEDVPVNAALNYGYAILLSMVNREIAARGYLTQCGVCHRNEYNQFNLACDFMEPFRPAVDRIVIDYMVDEFDKDMRMVLCDLGNKGMRYKDGTYRLSSVVSLYVQDCINALNKKISVDDIESFNIL